jgi:hypothetical protein
MFADVTNAGPPLIDAVDNTAVGVIVAPGDEVFGAADVPPPPPQPASNDDTISPIASDVFFMRAVSVRDMKRA